MAKAFQRTSPNTNFIINKIREEIMEKEDIRPGVINENNYSKLFDDDLVPSMEVSPDYKALYKNALAKLNSQQVVLESYKRVIKDLLEINNDN